MEKKRETEQEARPFGARRPQRKEKGEGEGRLEDELAGGCPGFDTPDAQSHA